MPMKAEPAPVASDAAAGPSSLPSTDAELRRIFAAHIDFVYRILRRFGVPAGHVEDAAQQVFLVVAKTLRTTTIAHERAFLFRTATHVALHARRKAGRTREVLGEELGEVRCTEALPDERIDQARARAALDDVLDEMSDELRTVFVLFELEELSMANIAEIVGIPAGTVASRLRRAREEFRDRLPRILARNSRRSGS